MDFSAQLDGLQRQVAQTKPAVQVASTESRDQLRQRIDRAQAETDSAARKTQQSAQGSDTPNKWAKMRADASDKVGEVKGRMDKRNREMDADMAADDAVWAEADAADALDYAAWTVDNARIAMLDAIDARAYATGRASEAR
jgi:hypothetical protein